MSKPLPPRPSDERSPLLPHDALPHDGPTPSPLLLFRRAIGINARSEPHDECNLEAGRATALGIYAATIAAHRRFRALRILVTVLVYTCHATQLVIGAVLTSMGPSAGIHRVGITVLGGVNTVVAGVLTWMKGQGMPDKLRRNETEFRRLQDWIEEMEALLMLGVVGGTRDEVGELITAAFRRWHFANERGEEGRAEDYRHEDEGEGRKGKGLARRWLRGW
ncbi:C6 transcription factor [Colletotrichum tofieldiae]|uniref:C6 transcription factor n=1 Tax=Colletotrichum tofieldiae TaxID=708197 RepID=A0A166SPU9_9PEZI|nr:C6 transcription factor [Colletotrichum tofieldiae]